MSESPNEIKGEGNWTPMKVALVVLCATFALFTLAFCPGAVAYFLRSLFLGRPVE